MSVLQVILTVVVSFILGSVFTFGVFRFSNHIGTMRVTEDKEGNVAYMLELEEEPEDLLKRRFITFMVDKRS